MITTSCPRCGKQLPPPLKSSGRQACSCGWVQASSSQASRVVPSSPPKPPEALIYLGAVCGVVAFFSLFVGSIPFFISATVSIACFIIYSESPGGKYKRQQKLQKIIERDQLIDEMFLRVQQNPDNIQLMIEIFDLLGQLDSNSRRGKIHTIVFPLLKLFPESEIARNRSFNFSVGCASSTNIPSELYRVALEILEENPEMSELKVYALEVGRWYYSSQRPDRKPTIYDEQAIQNDIIVRTK